MAEVDEGTGDRGYQRCQGRVDLEGEASGDFFQSLRLDITASAVNTGDASATLRVLDPDAFTSQRVRFNYDKDADIWNGS